VLALTFRAGDRWFETLRRAFVFPVVFAGSGIGDGNLTQAALAALADCDVCLYDALIPAAALNVLPDDCLKFDVGKRDGAGGGSQADLLEKMLYYARRNRKVVRLQGGDPGIFGRLGEELSSLEHHQLPFGILPGVSSFQAAAAALGRPLTGRGVGRGFVAATFRRAGDGRVEPPDAGEIRQFPLAVYMGARVFPDIARSLLAAGRAPDTPVAAVFDAGGPAEFTVSGRLDELVLPDTGLPGLLLVGPPAAARAEAWRPRILFAGSAGLAERTGRLIRARGGIPVLQPLLRLELAAEAAGIFDRLAGFAAVILPSPGAARLFFDLAKAQSFSLHQLPRLAVSGPATAAACREYGVIPDWTAPPPFGSAALAATLLAALPPGAAILRLHSDAAPDSLAAALRAGGMAVAEKLLYRSCRTENKLDFTGIGAILLSSASAVAALPDDVPPGLLLGAIGAPTLAAVTARFPDHPAAAGVEATLESLVEAVFHALVDQRLKAMDIS
jgi:siroheme synthase